MLGKNWQALNIVLPLGISFFTVTQIAFLVDVWKGTKPAFMTAPGKAPACLIEQAQSVRQDMLSSWEQEKCCIT